MFFYVTLEMFGILNDDDTRVTKEYVEIMRETKNRFHPNRNAATTHSTQAQTIDSREMMMWIGRLKQ